MQEKDKTATHFKANKRTSQDIGYAITLYRFMGLSKYGQTECNCTPELRANNSKCHFCISEKAGVRPQYLGPMGWSFHSITKDEDVLPKLLPIEKLEEITGDNLEKEIWTGDNIYSG
jgi:hypothetical protein